MIFIVKISFIVKAININEHFIAKFKSFTKSQKREILVKEININCVLYSGERQNLFDRVEHFIP